MNGWSSSLPTSVNLGSPARQKIQSRYYHDINKLYLQFLTEMQCKHRMIKFRRLRLSCEPSNPSRLAFDHQCRKYSMDSSESPSGISEISKSITNCFQFNRGKMLNKQTRTWLIKDRERGEEREEITYLDRGCFFCAFLLCGVRETPMKGGKWRARVTKYLDHSTNWLGGGEGEAVAAPSTATRHNPKARATIIWNADSNIPLVG